MIVRHLRHGRWHIKMCTITGNRGNFRASERPDCRRVRNFPSWRRGIVIWKQRDPRDLGQMGFLVFDGRGVHNIDCGGIMSGSSRNRDRQTSSRGATLDRLISSTKLHVWPSSNRLTCIATPLQSHLESAQSSRDRYERHQLTGRAVEVLS